jgi:hypothetical protein
MPLSGPGTRAGTTPNDAALSGSGIQERTHPFPNTATSSRRMMRYAPTTAGDHVHWGLPVGRKSTLTASRVNGLRRAGHHPIRCCENWKNAMFRCRAADVGSPLHERPDEA